jgi:4-amino-4-deoxy-L-arabinose transferase-like glycosyltransferase
MIHSQRRRNVYRAALAACAAFQVMHFLALPLVMSPDGLEYVALSERFGSSGFFEQWSYVRMPLYPLMLRGSFDLFGRTPGAALLPGALLGFIGAWVLAAEIGRARGELAGAAALVVLSAYPLLAGYEHTVLTETGTFCALSLVVVMLSRLARHGITFRTMVLLGVTLAVGYLFRATTIAVLPGVILVGAVIAYRSIGSTHQSRLALVAGVLVVAGLPFAAMRLWSAGGRDARIGSAFGYTLTYYLAAHGMLRSGDLGDAAAAYDKAKDAAAGQRTALVELSPIVAERLHAVDGKRLLREAIVTTPRAYLAALSRTALVFAGVPPQGSENHLFLSNVLSLSVPGSKCVCPDADQPAFARTFAQAGHRTPVQYFLKIVTPLYAGFVILGAAATLVGFAVGLRRADPALLAGTAVPMAFAAAHVVLLLGSDRFAMPVFPLALANLVVFASVLIRSVSVARTSRAEIPATAVGA